MTTSVSPYWTDQERNRLAFVIACSIIKAKREFLDREQKICKARTSRKRAHPGPHTCGGLLRSVERLASLYNLVEILQTKKCEELQRERLLFSEFLDDRKR